MAGIGWFKSKSQPKEEHRMQEEWERVVRPELPQGGSVIADLPISPCVEEPFHYRVIVVPVPRVDEKLIGKEYR